MKLFDPLWRLSRWAETNENQNVMHKLRAASALRSGEPVIGGPFVKSALDLSRIGIAVRCTMGEHMPDNNQDLASDDGDGFFGPLRGAKRLKQSRQ